MCQCISEWTQALYTLPRTLGERCLEVRTGSSFLNFPQATQHQVAMALTHSPHQSTACHPDSRKWPPHQAWCLQHPLGSLVCRQWAETRLYTWGRYSSGRSPVGQWCRCTSCGPIACTASTQWNCCRHPCSRQHRDTCLISVGHPGQHRRPWTCFFPCWHGALYFPCQPSMPWAWYTLLLGVCTKHQVTSIEKLPWHISAELARQCFQHQDEEQWAKDRALMHTNFQAKLLTVLTIDPYTALGIVVHALDDMHSPFIHTQAPQGPPQDLSWHMIEIELNRAVR